MKKFLKIIGLYLWFGALLAFIASGTGMFNGFMAFHSLGTTSFLAMIAVIMLVWLPSLVLILPSAEMYLPVPYIKLIIAAIIVVFIFLLVRILRKK
ncbi:MAG: hypothetical protein IKA10_07610 [Oscillospiraceae bacterium]|nr:hypothetical protein [Oscillospiraceae bacterium]